MKKLILILVAGASLVGTVGGARHNTTTAASTMVRITAMAGTQR
jgi:hypothetical protein